MWSNGFLLTRFLSRLCLALLSLLITIDTSRDLKPRPSGLCGTCFTRWHTCSVRIKQSDLCFLINDYFFLFLNLCSEIEKWLDDGHMVLYYPLSAVLFKREKNGVFRLKLREDLLVQFLCEQIFLMLHAQSFATDNRVLHLPECTAASVKKT